MPDCPDNGPYPWEKAMTDDMDQAWCKPDGCPAAICGGPHFKVMVQFGATRGGTPTVMREDQFKDHNLLPCPACGAMIIERSDECDHPFHVADDSHNYGAVMSREGTGADTGGQADPLVQEPLE
jgi:hypothetical protein